MFDDDVPMWVLWNRQYYREPWPAEHHSHYEVQYVKRGTGFYEIDGNRYEFGPQSLVSIRPGQRHSLQPNTNVMIEKAQFHFDLAWLEPDIPVEKTLNGLVTHVRVPDNVAWNLEMLANRLRDENTRRDPGWREIVRTMAREVMLWIKRAHIMAATESPAENTLITEIRNYVEENYPDPDCSVTAIANYFGYSLSYLSSEFKSSTGGGLKQYLLRRRIDAAQRKIEKQPGLKLEYIAVKSGFSQYRSFARSFQKITGESPHIYAKRFMK